MRRFLLPELAAFARRLQAFVVPIAALLYAGEHSAGVSQLKESSVKYSRLSVPYLNNGIRFVRVSGGFSG